MNAANDDKKMLYPLVSVIVPVYKVERYLERCLKSILNQTYENIEIILVDDGSPDDSGKMCDEYKQKDNRIVVIHKKNGGLSSARNAGMQVATGKFICFVDSDDWISLDMVTYMADLMITNQADIVSVSYMLVEDEDQKVTDSNKIKVMNREEALEYFLDIGMRSRISDYPVCIKMFRRELFDNVEFPVGTLYEDYTTNVQLIKKCTTYVKSSKICYFYYQGGQSIVRSYYKRQDNQLLSQCAEVCNLVGNEKQEIRKLAEEKLGRSYLSLLTKIAIYGFSDEIKKNEQKEIIYEFTHNLRKKFIMLIKSHMPFSRKIVLIVLCIDYHPLKIFRRVRK